ncbi:MAG TPA: hypothetical protein VF708_12750 [Pyrinomonadaceae bacterium]|jgi:hypothetical protein
MKRCPTCNRTYTDDALSFCLDDGGPLLSVADAPDAFDPNATMRYTEPRHTSSPTEVYRPASSPTGQSNQIVNPSWAAIPGAGGVPPPKKKSLLPWIIGGSVLVIVLGIGFVVLLAVLVSINSNSNNSNNSANRSNKNADTRLTNSNNSNSTNANSNSSAALTDDFSDAKWLTGDYSNGSFFYQNGEYHMRATANGSVVVYAPDATTYATQDSTVKVTVRSVSGTSPTYGYGLAVLGEMSKKSELEDYSFLIFTGNDPQYKVVLHQGGKETPIVKWTRTATIRTGSSPNQLEVRIKGDQLSFYINGQYATSIKDTADFGHGAAGFYTSDTHEVAFDDLEISR